MRFAIAFVVLALLATGCASDGSDGQAASVDPAVAASATATPLLAVEPTATPIPTADSVDSVDSTASDGGVARSADEVTPEPAPAPAVAQAPITIEQMDAAFAVSRLEAQTCPDDVAGDRVECFRAHLPVDVRAPSADDQVELMVARVDNGDPNDIGPVIFLQGGPGVASTGRANRFAGASHDMVFFDQRGTGHSLPRLACDETRALWVREFIDDPAVRLDDDSELYYQAIEVCRDRFASDGIELSLFNTEASAADVELLRRLFGHETWSVWGSSYGTRLGLTIMRDHPRGVRAAVLDSVLPLEVDFFATIPAHGIRAIEALDAACDASDCRDEHGDLQENLTALVQRLELEPEVVEATRPVTGETFAFRVDGAQLLDLVFTQLYSTGSLRSLPRQIARADFGGLDEIVAGYVRARDPNGFDFSVGLYYSTWCREEYPFYDDTTDDAILVEYESEFGPALEDALATDGLERICEIFSVEPSPPADDQLVESSIPTIVFAGAFDPITPPRWGRQVAAALSNATYVEMADHGHGMVTGCPASLRIEFLKDPGGDVDTSCADETDGPDFD